MAEKETNYKQGYSKSTLSSHTSRTVHSDAAFLLPHIKPTDKILDVGCGPGTITAGFASLTPKGSVVGVDVSESVLDHARAHVANLKETGALDASSCGEVSFQAVDLLAGLPWPDDTFDVVYASQLLPHLPPPDKLLRAVQEMRRVLRPGGILASRDVAEIHWYPRRLGMEQMYNPKMLRGVEVPDYVGGSLPGVLRDAGFNIDREKTAATSDGVQIGAGTTVYSSPEARKFWAGGLLGRLEEGDSYRASWLKAGISEEEIEETKKALKEWRDTDDAWYIAVQSEVLAWK